MANTLFPVFDVPEMTVLTAAKERKYRPSVYFDFAIGDFRRDGSGNMVQADGQAAYYQWCLKAAVTERFTCLSYTNDIGTEMLEALAQADRPAIESAVERTICETLMVNPKTAYVRDFQFFWAEDTLNCTFQVKGQDWEAFTIPIKIPL